MSQNIQGNGLVRRIFKQRRTVRPDFDAVDIPTDEELELNFREMITNIIREKEAEIRFRLSREDFDVIVNSINFRVQYFTIMRNTRIYENEKRRLIRNQVIEPSADFIEARIRRIQQRERQQRIPVQTTAVFSTVPVAPVAPVRLATDDDDNENIRPPEATPFNGRGLKRPNAWIQHVKAVAQKKGISYRDALKHPHTKQSYRK